MDTTTPESAPPPSPLETLIRDQDARRELARHSHAYFFALYLSHYLTHPSATFQKEMFALTEDLRIPFIAVTAFRGSAKSTIMTLSYVLWSIFGIQQRKNILIVTQTERQSALLMRHLKDPLENNQLLIDDLGPFREGEGEWKNNSLYLPKVDAKITAVSIEQSIRSFRHGHHRPDVIICDDIEDLASVVTIEGRDKTYKQLTSEIIPAGDLDTRIIVVGNLLHSDSVMMRLKRDIQSGIRDGVYREYPLLDAHGKCLWPEKFTTPETIGKLRRMVANEAAFQREFLLTIVTEEDAVIHPEWIRRWSKPPPPETIRIIATGVDPAISEKQRADCTAVVSVWACGSGDDFRIFVQPNVINERMGFQKILDAIQSLSLQLGNGRHITRMYVESVAYQQALIEMLQANGVLAEGVSVVGQDKRARLMSVSHLIEKGIVQFAPYGNDELIAQLLGFGKETHDDLVDALAMVLLKMIDQRGSMTATVQEEASSLREQMMSPDERRFWTPDHSGDFDGPGEDILSMEF